VDLVVHQLILPVEVKDSYPGRTARTPLAWGPSELPY
jgi:hypothetical protein